MMKKGYETPVAERIEFDYVESVRANSNGWCGGCGSGGNGNSNSGSGFDPFAISTHPKYGQQVYMQGNENYTCQNSLAPDTSCGLAQGNNNHTNNVGHFC